MVMGHTCCSTAAEHEPPSRFQVIKLICAAQLEELVWTQYSTLNSHVCQIELMLQPCCPSGLP